MPRFLYKAKSGPDQIQEGFVEAHNEPAAIYKINQMGLFPLEVTEEKPHIVLKEKNIFFSFFRQKKIGVRELGVFTRQLADLLSSGVTLFNALEILSRQVESNFFRVVIMDIYNSIEGGVTFSEALARYPRIFSSVYVSMAKVGEAGGVLEQTLLRLAEYLETEDQLRSKINVALAYPFLMAFVGIGTIGVLLTFVIPRLVSIFDDMGQALPFPTVVLIRISAVCAAYGWVLVPVGLFIFFIAQRHGATPDGKLIFDKIKLSIWGIGTAIAKSEIARFTRTLGILLTNGVPMMQSLRIAGATVENEFFRRGILIVEDNVAQGMSFSKAVAKITQFPLFVTNMISVGDESGHLDTALLKVAESCERDVDRAIKVFTALLEPFIILVMGSIVGFIVIAMLLPIFQINLAVR